MKTSSIFITIAGIAITIFCIIYFRPALNVVDSDPMTANPSGVRTTEWPIFIGLLTTFVGITFYFVATHDRTAKKK
jgi:uncharacterized BrkB/YihY/UPF0761 family membrane protein